jgi:hypothetical protein
MFGLLMRHIARPLAIMLSAKSGPGQFRAFASTLWPQWVVLIAELTGYRITCSCPSQTWLRQLNRRELN